MYDSNVKVRSDTGMEKEWKRNGKKNEKKKTIIDNHSINMMIMMYY